jgi:hypothetical protein
MACLMRVSGDLLRGGWWCQAHLLNIRCVDEKFFKENGTPLFSSHMIDLSEEAVDQNISTTAKYESESRPLGRGRG